MDGSVGSAIAGGVATVTLHRPARRNALDGAMRAALRDALAVLGADRAVRVVVLTGAPPAFCSGGDIAVLRDLKAAGDEADFVRLMDDGCAIVGLLRAMEKPTIAMVHGAAVGGGCLLAAACDMRLCGENARFALPFVRIGLGPDWGGAYILPRLIGVAKTLEMLYTGEAIDAAEALRVGLANRVWPDGELRERTTAFAQKLAQHPADALARFKKLLLTSVDASFEASAELERACQLESFRSADFTEGVAAFLEHRPPLFGDRGP